MDSSDKNDAYIHKLSICCTKICNKTRMNNFTEKVEKTFTKEIFFTSKVIYFMMACIFAKFAKISNGFTTETHDFQHEYLHLLHFNFMPCCHSF